MAEGRFFHRLTLDHLREGPTRDESPANAAIPRGQRLWSECVGGTSVFPATAKVFGQWQNFSEGDLAGWWVSYFVDWWVGY